MEEQENVIQNLTKVREDSPLVHNITNYVVMNPTANALLSAGASPVMAHAVEEVEEMSNLASALVVNIGTLSKKWVEAMFLAGKTAKKKGIPVVLDPVGAGATNYRTETAKSFIEEISPDIIRGNASEILSLVEASAKTKGVDSTESSDAAVEGAKKLASANNAVVSISGATDYITDGTSVYQVKNGSPLMGKITGTGCISTALIAAYAGVNTDYLQAATNGMVVMGIAGEMAEKTASAPGSFQIAFLDALYNIGENEINKLIK